MNYFTPRCCGAVMFSAIQVFRSLSRMAAADVEIIAVRSQIGSVITYNGFDDPNTANSVMAAMP